MSSRVSAAIVFVLSVLLLLLLWQLASAAGGEGNLLPPPLSVGRAVIDILTDPDNLDDLAATARRVLTAFLLAFAIAVAVGILSGSSRVAMQLLTPVIIVGLTIPAICWTAIAVMLFGIGDWTAIFCGTVIVTPVIASTVASQMRSNDNDLYVMARVYGFSGYDVLRHLILPQLVPPLLSGARYGLALCWKVIIIAELLGLSTGVGYQIAYWYNLFDLTNVFAWTAVFVGLMLLIEYGAIAQVEDRLLRWKKAA